MNKQQWMLSALVTAMLVTPTAAYAENTAKPISASPPQEAAEASKEHVVPIMERMESTYGSVQGTIKSIQESSSDKSIRYVSIEDNAGQPSTVVVSDKTFFAKAGALEVGKSITAYYDAFGPMPMIYPPQYRAEVLVFDGDRDGGPMSEIVKVDSFSGNLISSDGFLKLNLADSTAIVTRTGESYEGNLFHRRLVVYYGVSTKSIPAQTTPTRIVVLDPEPFGVIVGGHEIDGASAYADEQGVLMVPVRAVAEALGYNVSWSHEEQRVTLGSGISFAIGKDHYIYMRTAPIELGTAPVLKDGKTYVPIDFFGRVVRATTAELTSSKLVIRQQE